MIDILMFLSYGYLTPMDILIAVLLTVLVAMFGSVFDKLDESDVVVLPTPMPQPLTIHDITMRVVKKTKKQKRTYNRKSNGTFAKKDWYDPAG